MWTNGEIWLVQVCKMGPNDEYVLYQQNNQFNQAGSASLKTFSCWHHAAIFRTLVYRLSARECASNQAKYSTGCTGYLCGKCRVQILEYSTAHNAAILQGERSGHHVNFVSFFTLFNFLNSIKPKILSRQSIKLLENLPLTVHCNDH